MAHVHQHAASNTAGLLAPVSQSGGSEAVETLLAVIDGDGGGRKFLLDFFIFPRSIFSAGCFTGAADSLNPASFFSPLRQKEAAPLHTPLTLPSSHQRKTETANLATWAGGNILGATFSWRNGGLAKVQVKHYLHSQVGKCHAVCDWMEGL